MRQAQNLFRAWIRALALPPPTPIVQKGDLVRRGQKIAEGGATGVPLHATIAGKVKPIERVPHPVHVQKLDAHGRAYATGKRKNAVARVWVKPGHGKITVNEKDHEAYFARPVLQMILKQPLVTANRADQYDVVVTVSGGGLSGQAGAVRHGLSKALTYYEPALRSILKKEGFLTRDPRVVERKKYGKAKARRSFQFSKR